MLKHYVCKSCGYRCSSIKKPEKCRICGSPETSFVEQKEEKK